MNWLGIGFNLVLLILGIINGAVAFLLKPQLDPKGDDSNSSRTGPGTLNKFIRSQENGLNSDLTSNNAQESANFYTSDIGDPYNSASDYGSLFETFPSLPYFPEFEEIFRIPRTTTPEPPFRFPDYVRDVFPDRPPESPVGRRPIVRFGDAIGGGRRPSRRPPRPASSGMRTKITKHNQNEPKEKVKPTKLKPPTKSKDYPKIFRFTSDRVNLAEFDMKKKMNENYLTLAKGDELDSNKVRRNKFLILHGGIFEIEKSAFGRRHLYHASNNNDSKKAADESEVFKYKSVAPDDKTELETLPFFYKT